MSYATTRRAAATSLVVLAVAAVAAGCGASGGYDDNSPVWSPDGRQIAFNRIRGYELPDLYVMRRDGTRIRQLYARDVWSWEWSPDGKHIAFDVLGKDADGLLSHELWMVRVKDGSLTQLTKNTIDDEDPTWSPDGKQLAFVRGPNDAPGALAVMDVASMKVRVISLVERSPFPKELPAWSPDGRRIAFVGHHFGRVFLFIVNTDGRAERRVVVPGVDFGPPIWSPDGRWFLVTGGDSYYRANDIYRVRADGRKTTPLTTKPIDGAASGWSPDGTRILFHRYDRTEIYVMRADGPARRTPIPHALSKGLGADWSPDGRSIVFVRDRGDGRSRIYVMDARGRHIRELTDERRGTAPEEDR
jgi:Tol biopolymer transport system component